MPKIARDLAILVAFCGAFYLLIIFVRGETTKAATSSNFSIDRLEGDRMIQELDWDQAIVHFTRLVEKDKYNGLAQANLSYAEIEKLFDARNEFAEKAKSSSYSKKETQVIREELLGDAQRCIEIQDKLMRFPRYYSTGLRNLAALNCFLGKHDNAMNLLYEYMDEKNPTNLSIWSDPKLDPLRSREDFQQLLILEHRSPQHFRMPYSDVE